MVDIIRCTNCSKEVKDSFNYCPYCGNMRLTLDQIGLIILKCLNEIKLNAGRSLLSKVLKGSKSITVFQTKQNENHYFGFLNLYTTKEILDFINQLITRNYLSVDHDISKYHYPILKLTRLAEEHITMNKEISIIKNSAYHKKMEKIKFNYPHAYDLWKEEDERLLVQLFQTTKTINEISKLLGRQPSAIRTRIKRLGLIKD